MLKIWKTIRKLAIPGQDPVKKTGGTGAAPPPMDSRSPIGVGDRLHGYDGVGQAVRV